MDDTAILTTCYLYKLWWGRPIQNWFEISTSQRHRSMLQSPITASQ